MSQAATAMTKNEFISALSQSAWPSGIYAHGGPSVPGTCHTVLLLWVWVPAVPSGGIPSLDSIHLQQTSPGRVLFAGQALLRAASRREPLQILPTASGFPAPFPLPTCTHFFLADISYDGFEARLPGCTPAPSRASHLTERKSLSVLIGRN